MEGKEKSNEGLKKRIAARQTAMLHAMSDILDASIPPPRDQRDPMTVMSKQLRTQYSTQQIIRSCEDLLTLVRWMQERWLFGNLDTIGKGRGDVESEQDAKEILKMLERLDEMENTRLDGAD